MRRARDLIRGRRPKTLSPANARGDRPVLFFRNFQKFHGGHLKVWDYFNHVASSDRFTPYVTFTPNSAWDETNPWSGADLRESSQPRPDVLFLAGRDWEHVPEGQRDDAPVPVINLIQHVRHVETEALSRFFSHKAIRICVGYEVAEALLETGLVRGPVIAIPNGIDVARIVATHPERGRDIDLLVVANKQPELGRNLAAQWSDRAVHLVDRLVPRRELLALMTRAVVTLFLPNPTEGFYLPALEGMALRTVVVCPDSIGNRSFCIPGQTAFRPGYDRDALIAATNEALALDGAGRAGFIAAGGEMAAKHDLTVERKRFLEVLNQADDMWR